LKSARLVCASLAERFMSIIPRNAPQDH
jgi:hypothetical protein